MPSASEIREALDRLSLRKRAFMAIPVDVMEDLRGFCRAERSCWDADPRVHAVLEGRREVWLRIQQHIQLTPEELLSLYTDGVVSAAQLKGTTYAP